MIRIPLFKAGLVSLLLFAGPAVAQLTNPSRPANPLPPVSASPPAAPAPAPTPAPAPKPATAPAAAPAASSSAKEQSPLPTLNMVVPQRDRDAAFAYYRDEMAAGRCPAPLVRQDKACAAPPPAATRAWKLDQPLPDGVKAEPPPPGLIAKLSPSYAGHQYLRVGTDILIVGIGTRNVAALVVDLSRLTGP